MIYAHEHYTAKDILKEAGIDTTEEGFWEKHITIGGIQITSPDAKFVIGDMEWIMVAVGSNYTKCPVGGRK